MEGIYSVASSASSVTYGNIASAVKEMIIAKFPYQCFKYTAISTEIAHRNIRRQLGQNNRIEITKRDKPLLIIKPVFQAMNNDMYLYDIPLTKNMDNGEIGITGRYMLPIMQDSINRFKLAFRLNRDKFEFDVTITVSTLIQQIDTYKGMLNHMQWEQPYAMPTALEAMIPDEIIAYIGKLSHIDVSNADTHNIPILLKHMNRCSQYPITHKLRNSTATNEFFMYYNNNVIVTLSDLTIDEGTKKGMVDDDFNINFHISAEFNLPGLFALTTTDAPINFVKPTIEVLNPNSSSDFIPMFTLNNLYSRYTSMIDGYRMYTTSVIQMEPDPKTHSDSFNAAVFFEDEYIDLIKQTYANNVPVDTLVRIIIVKNSVNLVQGVDWNIEWSSMNITAYNVEIDSTYRILIYVNSIKINEELIIAQDDRKDDKSSL